MKVDVERTLEKVAYYFPGQNAFSEGMDSTLPSREDRPFGQAILNIRDVIGKELAKPILRPVILLGVSVGLAATLTWYLKSRPGSHVGLSMGEQAALVGAGYLELEDGLAAMKMRSETLANLPGPKTGLAAVIGLSIDDIKERVIKAGQDGLQVDWANINTQTQGVIGFWSDHFEALKHYFTEARLFPLEEIPQALHTRFVSDAAERFRNDLPTIINPEKMGQAVGKVFSAMRAGRGLDPIVGNSEDAYDVVASQIDSKVDQPTVFHRLMELMGIEDIVDFDLTGGSLGMVRTNVGRGVRVHLVRDAGSLKETAQILARIYGLKTPDFSEPGG